MHNSAYTDMLSKAAVYDYGFTRAHDEFFDDREALTVQASEKGILRIFYEI
jgi:hypothetical protein